MTSGRSVVTVIFDIEANPGKKQELLQTLNELCPIIRAEAGCLQVSVSPSELPTATILVSEKWATAQDALRHIHSKPFHVFRGAANVLATALKMSIGFELASTSVDMKKIEARNDIYQWAENALSKSKG